jgi:hypothetical protein
VWRGIKADKIEQNGVKKNTMKEWREKREEEEEENEGETQQEQPQQ